MVHIVESWSCDRCGVALCALQQQERSCLPPQEVRGSWVMVRPEWRRVPSVTAAAQGPMTPAKATASVSWPVSAWITWLKNNNVSRCLCNTSRSLKNWKPELLICVIVCQVNFIYRILFIWRLFFCVCLIDSWVLMHKTLTQLI